MLLFAAMDDSQTSDRSIIVSLDDIREAASQGVISQTDSDNLIYWICSRDRTDQYFAPAEQAKGFNIVTVAYYFGAMLMISACAWFLGDKWDSLGSGGILATTLVYFTIAATLGWWLRSKGYVVGGGLLITVAVCLTPLIVYCVEDLTGFWPGIREKDPTKYKDFYPYIRSAWIIMELSTVAVALVALYFARFGFLTAPIAFSLWFFSMDVAAWIYGDHDLDWNTRAWISILVGVPTILIGYVLQRILHKPGEPKSQDFAFWCYFFGLPAFWGGMTALDSDSETGKFIYFLINIGLVAVSLYLRRSVFLVFGALGISMYLGHLAYEVFQDSVLFPFAIALIGLSMIVATVLGQKFLHRSGRRLP
jgi:hypothetical protein